MAQQQKKKSARAKRSRLGRGLSALVDTPVVVEGEVEQSSKSDKSGASSGSISVGPDKSGNDGGDVTNFNPELSQRPVVKDVADPIRSAVENKDIQQAEPGVSHGSVEQRGERVLALSLGVIGVNRDQPRSTFDEDALESLASSIRAHGVMQPIVVRNVLEKRDDGIEFELVAGERRWRAAQIAELDTIPAVVREIDDATSAQLALIENVQREDLNPVELAEGYRALSDRYGMTQEAIAKQVGVSRSSVTNMIRLLELPEQVRAMVASGVLSMGHGKALLSLKSEMKQRKFGALAIKDGWNVRQLERAIQDEIERNSETDSGTLPVSRGNPEDARAISVLRDLEVKIGEALGTRVKIKTDKSRQRGRVVIEFYDLDQFDGLLGRLGVGNEG